MRVNSSVGGTLELADCRDGFETDIDSFAMKHKSAEVMINKCGVISPFIDVHKRLTRSRCVTYLGVSREIHLQLLPLESKPRLNVRER